MRNPWLLSAPHAFLLAVLLSGCGTEDFPETSPELLAGKTTGILYRADGKPARRARVRVLPVNYQPHTDSASSAVFSTTTDDKGRYFVDSMASGEYNILSELDGEAAYQDSVLLSGTARNLSSDTLEEPGTLSGRVVLQPGDPVASATVQVLGTLAYANVEDDGSFRLPSLAPGLYQAAVDADLPGYTTRYYSWQVRSGRADSLADTLSPRFTGIPQVTGLRVKFDTLAQAVHLTWSPTPYANLKDYLVLRAPQGSIVGPSIIAALSDTAYVDFPPILNPFPPNPSDVGKWEYRVVIRDKFGVEGRAFGGVEIATPPAATAATTLSVRIENAPDGMATIGDTVLFIADWQGTSRGLVLLRWFPAGSPNPIRSVSDLPRGGRDTLIFIAPRDPSLHSFRVEIADEGGAEWGADAHVRVTAWHRGPDMPVGSRGPSVIASGGRFYHLGPHKPNPTSEVHEFDPAERTWRLRTAMPRIRSQFALAEAEGYIYVFGGVDGAGVRLNKADRYHPETDTWTVLPDMPTFRSDHAAVSHGGRIYVFGGNAMGEPSPRDCCPDRMKAVDAFDPATGTWDSFNTPIPFERKMRAVVLRGTIHVISLDQGRAGMFATFHPAANSWSNLAPLPFVQRNGGAQRLQEFAVHALSGKIVLAGGVWRHATGPGNSIVYGDPVAFSEAVHVYDPVSESWSRSWDFATGRQWPALASLGDDLYLLGGDNGGAPHRTLEIYPGFR